MGRIKRGVIDWMNVLLLSCIVSSLGLGWFGHAFYSDLTRTDCPVSPTVEKKSPHNRIENVQGGVNCGDLFYGGVFVPGNFSLATYIDTNSMDPILDEEATGIEMFPESEGDLFVGDIISYVDGVELIAHRIIEKGVDENGTYFITKGDNNAYVDGRIRFSQVRGVLVGVLY